MALVGHITGVEGTRLFFAADLDSTLAEGDSVFSNFVESVDRFVEKNRLDAAPPDGHHTAEAPHTRQAITDIDLARAGIRAIVWATGFRRDFDWIRSPAIVSGHDPVHVRGVSTQPGLFFLGLRWLHTRRSNFIDGAGADAAYVRDRIVRRD